MEKEDGAGRGALPEAAPRIPRCSICGRFLGRADFDLNSVGYEFTPDTSFTAEKMEWFHRRCATTP